MGNRKRTGMHVPSKPKQSRGQTRRSRNPAPRLYGLLITKDDHDVFEEWCQTQLGMYDAVVCLDGSVSARTGQIARGFANKLVYLHERDFAIPHKTDHGLRRVVHEEIVRRSGAGHWVMCCHTDEFCYHDPRAVAVRAAEEGYDQVAWFSLHFYPHPNELPDWDQRRRLPITERHRYYHWSYCGNGLPWLEDRLYLASPEVAWDGRTHGSARPWGLMKPAPFHPILQHYKVIDSDPASYERADACAHYKQHWQTLQQRTGLPYAIRRFEDLFVSTVRDYAQCDRFDGILAHPWNMGEEYRARPGGKAAVDHDRIEQRAVAVESTRVSRASVRTSFPAVEQEYHLVGRGRSEAVRFATRGAVDEAIRRDLWERDVYQVRALPVTPNTVMDIGGHIGAFALLAIVLWPSAQVVSCEPDPDNCSLFRHNLRGRPQVRLVEAAVIPGDEGQVTLHAVPDKAGSNSGGGSFNRPEPDSVPIQVPAISTVRLWEKEHFGYCDVLKLDCEGAEVDLLRALGAAGLLRKIGWIVGEWHAADARQDTVNRVQQELAAALLLTHEIRFSPARQGREGHFTAKPRPSAPALAADDMTGKPR